MNGKLAVWNQYGFETDVFDKYRDAVKRSNRDSIKVLSFIAIVTSIATIVFGLTTNQEIAGLYFCLFMLSAGIAGVAVSSCVRCTRTALLTVGYILSASIHLLAVFG